MVAALLAFATHALQIKEAAIADLQAASLGGNVEQGRGTIGSASVLQVRQLHASAPGIVAQMQFTGRQTVLWAAAATALKQAGQFVGQSKARTILQRDLLKAIEQGDGDRISHDHLTQGHLEEGFEEHGRRDGEALVQPLPH